MEFCGVIPKDLATGVLWPQIAQLVARAIPFGRGEFEIEDIRAGIEDGSMAAIGVVVDGRVEFVATCAVITTPRKSFLYIQYGAGIGAERAKDAVISAARILGADWIETRCRESVARLYRLAGFDTAYQVCILETPR